MFWAFAWKLRPIIQIFFKIIISFPYDPIRMVQMTVTLPQVLLKYIERDIRIRTSDKINWVINLLFKNFSLFDADKLNLMFLFISVRCTTTYCCVFILTKERSYVFVLKTEIWNANFSFFISSWVMQHYDIYMQKKVY